MIAAATKAKYGTEISLTFSDGTVKIARVNRLTNIITWKGKYFFLRKPEIGFTHYEQTSGTDLSNIEIV